MGMPFNYKKIVLIGISKAKRVNTALHSSHCCVCSSEPPLGHTYIFFL